MLSLTVIRYLSYNYNVSEVNIMLDRLNLMEDRYEALNGLLSDPEVINDVNKLRDYSKEQAELEQVITTYRKFKDVSSELEDAEAMVEDELDDEMKELVEMEIHELTEQKADLEEQLKIMLLPRDPNDDKNVIVEIRAAAGGDEAGLFAADLYRMFTRYAEKNRWHTELIEADTTGVGGFKEVIFMINGDGAYSQLKYENGAHRVQRVPETESGGRVHTSTATVAVLPEAEEVDVEIRNEDIKIDTYRSSGAGGQHVNTTDSAVRITHEPTGIVVACQSQRSQHANRDFAMKQLKAKLWEHEMQKRNAAKQEAEDSKADIGWGSQIRSYVLDDQRIKDLRTGVQTSNCDKVLDGDLDQFIVASLKQGL